MIADSNGERCGDTRPLWITGLSPPDSWRSLRQPGYLQLDQVRTPKHCVWGYDRTLKVRNFRSTKVGNFQSQLTSGTVCGGSFFEKRLIETPEDARGEVDEIVRKLAPDVLKLAYHPYQRALPSIDRATMAAAIAQARGHGLKAVVNVDSWAAAVEAIEAGAAAITHVPVGPMPDAAIAAFLKHGARWIPTLSVHTGLADFLGNEDLLGNPLLAAVARERLRESYAYEVALPVFRRMEAAAQRQKRPVYLASVARAAAAGVPILVGSEAGFPGTFQGFAIHREMALLVEAGLTPWQALQGATTDAGAFLGLEVGVRRGDLANLVVLGGSPIDDIENTQGIVAVIHDGRVVDREALLNFDEDCTFELPTCLRQ